MDKYRLRFKKTGRAKYISHLDLMRVFQRAFLRAGLPIKYSEGFNPHALISILLPLPLGDESVCELMDFRLREILAPEDVLGSLNPALPEGIEGISVYRSEAKAKDIKWLEISGLFVYDSRPLREMKNLLADFFSRESIVIQKKTKRGLGELNIRPHLRDESIEVCNDSIELHALISATDPTLRPDDLQKALSTLTPELAPDLCLFKRLELYSSDLCRFI